MYFRTTSAKSNINRPENTKFSNTHSGAEETTAFGRGLLAKQLTGAFLSYPTGSFCAKSLAEPEASPAEKLCQLISNVKLNKKSCLNHLKKKKTHAKFVHFGIDLEKVRFFAKTEPPENCKSDYDPEHDEGSYKSLGILSAEKQSETEKIHFTEVSGPVKVYTFNDNRVVFLDQITFDNTDNIICGVIRVQNLDFIKQVCIKYTFDVWNSMNERAADFTGTLSNPEGSWKGLDSFSFALEVSDKDITTLKTGKQLTFEFCIRYCVKDQEYWDNNDGKNYIYKIFIPAAAAAPAARQAQNKKLLAKPIDDILCGVLDDSFIAEPSTSALGKSSMYLNAPKTLKFASFNSDSMLNGYTYAQTTAFRKSEDMAIPKSTSMPNLKSPIIRSSPVLSSSPDSLSKQVLSRPKSHSIHNPVPTKRHSMFEISPNNSPDFAKEMKFSNVTMMSPMLIQPRFPNVFMSPYDDNMRSPGESHLTAFDYHGLSSSPLNDSYSLIY